MKTNLGYTDRILRILFAIIFVSLYSMREVAGVAGILLLVLASILILTSVLAFSPLYALFGLSTHTEKRKT